MGEFVNRFAQDPAVFWSIAVAGCLLLLAFGLGYNSLMGRMGRHKSKLTAILVALGVAITLTLAAVISWKASALLFIYFIFSGTPMIIGDVIRSIVAADRPEKSCPKRKPLPYAAAGLVDEAVAANSQALRHLTAVIEKRTEDHVGKIALAIVEVSRASQALAEVKQIRPD